MMKKPGLITKFFFLVIALFFTIGFSWSQTQSFTSGGTFTVPANVNTIIVECWGAGGGGSNRSGAAGGGGGGAYTRGVLTGLTPGSTITVTVGTGGTAGNNGGQSLVSTIVANGGQSVGNSRTGGTGGAASAVGGDVTASYSGGTGGNARAGTGGGSNEGGGGGGGSATTTANGGNGGIGTVTGGAGGTGTGAGGNGGDGTATPDAAAGSAPGGGGGGRGEAGGTSKAGANGQVIISWLVFYSQSSGDPNTLTNWNSNPGGGGVTPSNFTTNNQAFIIQSGHTMTTTGSGWTVSGSNTKVQIQSGGILTETTAISFSANTTLQLDNGGVLNHNVNSVTIFTGTETFGNTSTVNYGFSGAQTVLNSTYGNLTLSGSGSKSITTSTVNGILSMEGTATASAAPTYGASATLQYMGSSAQATGNELPATFSGAGGVIINNTFGVSLSSSVTISNTLNLVSGALSIGANTLTLNGQLNCGTLIGGATSNLIIGGSGTASLSGVTLNNLTINRAVSMCGNVTVGGTLTLTSGTFIVGANTLTLNGPTIAGTPSNLSTTSSSSLIFGGTTAGVLIPPGVTALNGLSVTNTSIVTLQSSPTVSGTFNPAGGGLSVGANTLTLNGQINCGTLVGGATSSLVIGGAGTASLSGVTLNNLTVNRAVSLCGNVTVGGTLTLTSGTFAVGANTLTLNGPTIAGTPSNLSTTSSSSLIFGGTTAGVLIPTGVTALNGLSVTNTSIVTLQSSPTVSGTFNPAGGGLSVGANTLTLNGQINCGTLAGGATSSLIIGGAGTASLSGVTLNNLTVSRAVTLCGNVIIGGTLTLTSGTFAVGANTLTLNGPTIAGTPSNLSTTSSSNLIFGGTSAGVLIPSSVSNLNNLTVNNTNGISLTGNVAVGNALNMTLGNITTGSFTLALSNGLASSLTYVSGTIIGRIRRTISTTLSTNYLFPVGTAGFYRPAVMNFSSISAGTDITAEFIPTSPSGFSGYTDGTSTLSNTFTEGYWSFSSSTLPTVSYALTLTGNGFTSYTINGYSRITGRDNGNSTWRALGTHGTQTGNDVSRTGVTNLNSTSFDFALANGCSTISMGYGYERDITIDRTRVSGGSDLFSFPVLINLSGQTFLRTSPTGQITSTNGYDIIFTDNNYNKLDHQLEYYNGTNGDLIAWVRVPVLSLSANTVIKILYGNLQVTTDLSTTLVWDSNYKGVWHLDNSSLNDFTSYARAGTPYNTPTYNTGRINNSIVLNGSNQYVEVINDPNINFAGNITISAWVYMTTGGRDQKIASNQNNSTGGYKFGVYTNNKVEFEIRNSSNTPSLNRDVTGGTVLTTGTWYYLAGMSSDVLDSIKTFVNGVPERPFKKTGILGVASNTLVISKEPFLTDLFFAGRFDELRISDKVRSNGWLRTEYNNQSSPATFYSVSSEAVSYSVLSASTCDLPITLSFGYPSGGTYSGNSYTFQEIHSILLRQVSIR